MSTFSTPIRYGSVAQLFHWLTAGLVVAAYAVSVGGPQARVYGDANAANLMLHESLGIAVLMFVALRLSWRAIDRAPDDPPMRSWMLLASRVTHWALYGLLFAIPLTAIFGAWMDAHPITVYGLGAIGPYLGKSSWGTTLADFHGTLGNAILWLAGLHASAALFHHFVLRDRVLKTMLPIKISQQGPARQS